jgi:hypothetical protein
MLLPLLLGACSGQDKVAGPSQSQTGTWSTYRSPHLIFYYTRIDQDSIQSIAQYVEASYGRIVADLKPDSLGTIAIHLYSTLKDVHRAMGMPDAPSWVKGSIISADEVAIISPNSADLDHSVTYDYMLSCIVHEFAHCVTLHVNPTAANRPRWLWESVAIYESGQFVDPKRLDYLADGSPPSLAELNDINDTRVYDVGYTLAEYIVSTWGSEALRRLIRSNGDLLSTLRVTEMAFQTGWYDFVTNKYLR